MNFVDVEKLFWPFVLLVGRRITSVNDSLKQRFWRDHTIMCGLTVLPAIILDWLTSGLPVSIYPALIALGGFAYINFIYTWRKYLNNLN